MSELDSSVSESELLTKNREPEENLGDVEGEKSSLDFFYDGEAEETYFDDAFDDLHDEVFKDDKTEVNFDSLDEELAQDSNSTHTLPSES